MFELNNIDFFNLFMLPRAYIFLFKGRGRQPLTESPKDPFKHPFKVYW